MNPTPFTRPGSSLAELDAAWPDRLADAESLLASGRNGWAIATGLYALEIKLKTLICRRLDLDKLPKAFETHDLTSLLIVAGLSNRIQRMPARRVKPNWDVIERLAEKLNDFRYTADAKWSSTVAADFFSRLRDAPHGVLPWLNKVR